MCVIVDPYTLYTEILFEKSVLENLWLELWLKLY